MGCDIHLHVEMKSGQRWAPVVDPSPGRYGDWDVGRDYRLFSLLAGVRNYSDFTPIAEPRGLPADVSAAVGEDAERWEGDGHSHSWLSLSEILSFDYSQSIKHTAYFDGSALEKAQRYLNTGYPLDDVYPRAQWSSHGTELSWESEYWRSLSLGWLYQVQKMARIAILECGGDLSAVRIVFWFDN